jgi:hypothetical protein
MAAALALLAGVPAWSETVIQVGSSSELSTALSSVPDGGVIELLNGTYLAPAGGFTLIDPGRSFTIRARSTGSAVLDGQGSSSVFTLLATSPLTAGWVSFEGLVFQNGFSAIETQAGGVTINGARASFSDCTFDSNHSDPNTTGAGGGGTSVIGGAFAVFNRCIWRDNTAVNFAGGLLVGGESEVFVHDSQFLNNRTDIADHRPSASGAGANVRAATAWFTNTRFEGNVSGFTGGGLKVSAAFTDPEAFAVIANCTFVDNRAEPHPTVTPPSPPSGGALMVEALAEARIYNSRFITNSAVLGGAISTYRSVVSIESSIFRGNDAVSVGSERGRGGAIKASSSDVAEDGDTNYRSAELVIRNSFFEGRYGGAGATGQSGGCIYAAGDTNRMYGQSGVSQMGSLAVNRALVDIDDSVFVDCDVDEFVAGLSIFGGGISGNLVRLTADNTTFVDCDAFGSVGRGGAAAFSLESLAEFTGCTFVGNTGADQGGALRLTGSELQVNACEFYLNEVSPGVAELENESQGAAIYTTPYVQAGIDATGLVRNSAFVSNIGLAIFDEDRHDSGVINDVRYNGNSFFESTFDDRVYRDRVASQDGLTAAELNALVVMRNSGVNTDKSPLNNNSEEPSQPVSGSLRAAPQVVIDAVASGDPASSTESLLTYTWVGGSATLDGAPVSGNSGVVSADVGSHTLQVGGQSFSTTIGRAPLPQGSLTTDPEHISSGQQTTLEWATVSGTFVNSVIDWGVDTGGDPAGSIALAPPGTRTYVLNLVTEQGGAAEPATVFVDETPPAEIFADGFESGDAARWSSSTP